MDNYIAGRDIELCSPSDYYFQIIIHPADLELN